VLGKFRHRAVVGVHSLLRVEGRWAILMEYVEGVDLGKVIREDGKVPVSVALEIVGEVASALSVAYNAKDLDGTPLHLVHRDIKPSNIMVTAAGEVKVLDFGIAKGDFADRESKTRAGDAVGSLMYMSPERFEDIVGPAADTYALGVMLYELLLGEPFGFARPIADAQAEAVDKAIGQLREATDLFTEEDLTFIGLMLGHDHTARPDARQVCRWCHRTRLRAGPMLLDEWAEPLVTSFLADSGRTRVGDLQGERIAVDVVTEDVAQGLVADPAVDEPAPTPKPVSATPWMMAVAAALIGGVLVGRLPDLLEPDVPELPRQTVASKDPAPPPAPPVEAQPAPRSPTDEAQPPQPPPEQPGDPDAVLASAELPSDIPKTTVPVVPQLQAPRTTTSRNAATATKTTEKKPAATTPAPKAAAPKVEAPEEPPKLLSDVTFTGASAVTLVGSGGSFRLPTRVAQGDYTVKVEFPGEAAYTAGVVSIDKSALSLQCSASRKMCRAK
jgi:serine/threonine protein kinase